MATQSIKEETTTATFKVVSKGRKLFKVIYAKSEGYVGHDGFYHEPMQMDCEINESNKNWQVDEIVKFVGKKITKSSKYGSNFRFIPDVKAEEEKEEAGAIWVEVEEKEVVKTAPLKKQFSVSSLTEDEKRLSYQFSRELMSGFSDLNTRILNGLFEKIQKSENADFVEWAEEKMGERAVKFVEFAGKAFKGDEPKGFWAFGVFVPEKSAVSAVSEEQKLEKSKSYDFRVLYAEDQEPKVKSGYVMTGRGKSFRISNDHPSYEGAHLLGYEGELGSYAYYKKEVKKDKAQVMCRAWVIAREAQAKFGGKASQYLSGALKAAWAE